MTESWNSLLHSCNLVSIKTLNAVAVLLKVKGGGRLLEIKNTTIIDSGAYTCKIGKNSHTMILQVVGW